MEVRMTGVRIKGRRVVVNSDSGSWFMVQEFEVHDSGLRIDVCGEKRVVGSDVTFFGLRSLRISSYGFRILSCGVEREEVSSLDHQPWSMCSHILLSHLFSG